jgi:hypothetical protein
VKKNKGHEVATIDADFKKKLKGVTRVWTVLDKQTIGEG